MAELTAHVNVHCTFSIPVSLDEPITRERLAKLMVDKLSGATTESYESIIDFWKIDGVTNDFGTVMFSERCE